MAVALTIEEPAFERHEHPPVATVEQAAEHWAGIDAAHCKNLFLRNQKGDRHYLLIVEHSKKADLRAVANQIGEWTTRMGTNHINSVMHVGDMPHWKAVKNLTMFAEEVIPRLRAGGTR